MSYRLRRLQGRLAGQGAVAAPSLSAVAAADGATEWYTFDEASGNLLDHGAGAWNLASHSQVTRGVAAVNGPDRLAYTFITTSQGATTYGHTQGQRPLRSSWNRMTLEAIVAVAADCPVNVTIIDAAAVGTIGGLWGLGTDASGNILGTLATNNPDSRVFANSLAGRTSFRHYLWLFDGSFHTGYMNGVQGYSAAAAQTGNFFDDTSGNARQAFGGNCDSGAANSHSSIDFFALYGNIVLSAGQIANHFALSGG